MATREERIASLAATLKASGVAKSESQAKMMAEEMIGVEDSVQKRFSEEHAKADEFLRTAKNLGNPRPRQEQASQQVQQKQAPTDRPSDNVLIRPIEPRTVDEEAHDKVVKLEPVHTDSTLSNKSLKDLMFEQIEQDGHAIKNIEELKPVETPAVEAPEASLPEQPAEAPKLDSQKLVELMEEDGKLEEHTREIKEKPKVVKPKEEYAENSVDLSAMFNVHK